MHIRIPVIFQWFIVGVVVASGVPERVEGQDSQFLGSWDVVLESPGGELRFGLSIDEDRTGRNRLIGFLHNGPERIEIPEVVVEGGTLELRMTHYDSILKFEYEPKSKRLEGQWRRRRGVNEWVEMVAAAVRSQQNPRTKKRDFKEFPGRWEVKFSKSEGPAVAIFRADNTTGHIVGTFLTTTGDYRYLDGRIDDETLELSCFDGAHAFLFRCRKKGNDRLEGEFWSSTTWHESWTAKRNPDAKLPDGFAETKMIKNPELGEFSFPDLKGEPRRLNDPEFDGKARIIYVFGSWCPNCHDAGKYFAELQDWYGDDLHILGLAFEVTGDFDRDARQVREYMNRHGGKYPVLVAGLSDKKAASRALPFLDRVRAYPTTLFLDSRGNVEAIHSGFSGPATGEAYSEQKKKFESIIDRIIAKAKKGA